MEKLPPEGHAIVAEYYARLREKHVVDIDAKVEEFEMAVRDTFGPIIDNNNPISITEAKDQLNTLREFARSIGVGVREHCLDPLPVVAMGLLFGCVYLIFEYFTYHDIVSLILRIFLSQDQSTLSAGWGFLYSMSYQLIFCLVVLAIALRIVWPTEGYCTRVVLAIKHIRSYFSTDFRVKEFLPDFLVTSLYLYLVSECALIITSVLIYFAWVLAGKVFNLLFNDSMAQFIACLSLKMSFRWMTCLMWNTYVTLWGASIDIIYTDIFLEIGGLVFLPFVVYSAVRWMNKFMHLPWVRTRLDALEYRLYRLFSWLHRRGFSVID